MPSPLPNVYVLYINLAAAEQRRTHMEAQLAPGRPLRTVLRPVHVERMPAVEGPAVLQEEKRLLRQVVTPWASLLLRQPLRASSHAQIETPGAVGCYLSHVRCWDWLLHRIATGADRDDAVLLVLEDDACLSSNFETVWRRTVQPLLAVPPQERKFELLLLGFHFLRGTRGVHVHGVPLRTFAVDPEATFHGTHGYLVTVQGAKRLREHALPMEVQVDHYFLVLQQLGLLQLFLLPEHERCVEQCLGTVDVGIRHGYITTGIRNCTLLMPPGYWFLLLLTLSLLVWLICCRVLRCGARPCPPIDPAA